MLKTAFVAACVLAVSGSVAFAQSRLQGPSDAPYGANGAVFGPVRERPARTWYTARRTNRG